MRKHFLVVSSSTIDPLLIIIILLFFVSPLSCQQTTNRIIFMTPAEQNAQHQLNTRVESLFPSLFTSSKAHENNTLKGWYVESHVAQKFNLFLLLDTSQNTSSPPPQFYIYFTLNSSSCHDYLSHTHIPLKLNSINNKNASLQIKQKLYKLQFEFELDYDEKSDTNMHYVCLSSNLQNVFIHQGDNPLNVIILYKSYLSMWSKLVFYAFLVLLNAIFNGLNLGLMSLSVEELELLEKTSDSLKEKQYAHNILPLRRKGNYLLCSILLSVTLTGSVSTLVLGDMFEGLIASIISTLCLSIIGEILPQSICTKYSLEIGSYTRRFTYFFIYLTTIVSYPLGKLIDYVLGKELPTIYSIDTIKELIKKSNGLLKNQCQIIHGALDLKSKKVHDIMTPIDDVFMLDDEETLNFETLVNIYNSGFSRIPVYKKHDFNDIVGWFHIKDLTLVDPDDGIQVKTILSIYKHRVAFCYSTDSLVKMFEKFRLGSTHLAFVIELVETHGETDPYEKCVGIVTLHDVFEAITSCDIKDELNCLKSEKASFGVDYLKKLIKTKYNNKKSVHNDESNRISIDEEEEEEGPASTSTICSASIETSLKSEHDVTHVISLQTKLALLQILTTIHPFKEEFIDRQVLEKLLDDTNNLFHNKYIFSPQSTPFNLPNTHLEKQIEHTYLYKYNVPCDFFILLVEGCLLVEAGKEKTQFLTKQFDYFGKKALLGEANNVDQVLKNTPPYKPYIPEYSLKIDYKNYYVLNQHFSALVYLKIDRQTWLNAVNSTYVKRMQIIK